MSSRWIPFDSGNMYPLQFCLNRHRNDVGNQRGKKIRCPASAPFAGAQIWTGHRLGGKPPGICGNPMAEHYFTRIDEAIRFWMLESSLSGPTCTLRPMKQDYPPSLVH